MNDNNPEFIYTDSDGTDQWMVISTTGASNPHDLINLISDESPQ